MHLEKASIDDIWHMANRGNITLWRKEESYRPRFYHPFYGLSAPFGQLGAVRYIQSKDEWWCAYRFSGVDVREYLESHAIDGTDWHMAKLMAKEER